MLEFNQWFFVLLANFLVLFFVLSAILFKPLARILKERESSIKSAIEEARAMTAKKDDAVIRMNAELLSAKNKARETMDGLRAEGQAVQKEALSGAEAGAVEMIEKARKELQVETDKARASLQADIDTFSEEIVKKLVKA
jgi:F-type H+-transporting ATPase subunit b